MMNFRLAQPSALVDLNRIPGLTGIAVEADRITIGAMATHAEIERSEELAEALPIAREAAREIGHPAIRNAGTIGGSLAHADAAAEWPVVLLALDASVRAESSRGSRSIKVADLLAGYFTTTMEPDELLTAVEIPRPAGGATWCFKEFARQSGAFGLVLVAVIAESDGGRLRSARIAFGGCGGVPILVESDRIPELVELVGAGAFEEAAERAVAAVDSWSADVHATAEDRREIATTLTTRALREACGSKGDGP
jgi:CO/xanthine dehydrogenase FAD-binding subunit